MFIEERGIPLSTGSVVLPADAISYGVVKSPDFHNYASSLLICSTLKRNRLQLTAATVGGRGQAPAYM